MAQRKSLTEQQVAVLRWVGDGCPEGVMPDMSHRISTAALDKRGLISVTGNRDTWSAEITKAGGDYLEAVDGPNPPTPRQENRSVTAQLVQDVIDAGGVLPIPERNIYEKGSVDYERRARIAEERGKVPDGKWLLCIRTEDGKELRLIDATIELSDEANKLVPIEIPERVSRYHPVARRFRDAKSRHEVSRAQLTRVVKTVHAIITEAERRGWRTSVPVEHVESVRAQDWSPSKTGNLCIEVGARTYRLRFREEGVDLRGPWDEQTKRYREHVYWHGSKPEGSYDGQATGAVRIELIDENRWSNSGTQSQWGDKGSQALEERVPYLFREIERRLVDADRDAAERRIEADERAERERKAAEARRKEWERHIHQAKQQLLEQRRAETLRDQATRWQEAEAFRSYRDAMKTKFGSDDDTNLWIEWIDAFIEKLDPLTEAPTIPADPEESVDALQPYMPGNWSAQDPELVFDPQHGHRRPYRSAW